MFIGRNVEIKEDTYWLVRRKHLGGCTGVVVKDSDPYFEIEINENLNCCGKKHKCKLPFHWSQLNFV